MNKSEKFELYGKIDNVFWDIVDEFDLDYGNSGYSLLNFNGTYRAWIETPNHTVLGINIEFDPCGDFDYYTDEKIRDMFLDAIVKSTQAFDPEYRFEKIWHPDFRVRAFKYMKILKEDKQFFTEVVERIEKDRKKKLI